MSALGGAEDVEGIGRRGRDGVRLRVPREVQQLGAEVLRHGLGVRLARLAVPSAPQQIEPRRIAAAAGRLVGARRGLPPQRRLARLDN